MYKYRWTDTNQEFMEVAATLPAVSKRQLPWLSLQVSPAASTRDSWPPAAHIKRAGSWSPSPSPPSLFLSPARLLLYPPFFLYSNSKVCFLSWCLPPHPHWHPPPHAPSLLPLVLASVGFSASLTLCTLWLLFVHLSVPLCACFRCSSVS